MVGGSTRKPPLVSLSGLLPLAAHKSILAGGSDHHPRCVCTGDGRYRRWPQTTGATDICQGTPGGCRVKSNFRPVAANTGTRSPAIVEFECFGKDAGGNRRHIER